MPVYTCQYFTEYTNDKGKKHRDDGPAMIFNDGHERWYRNGKLHRKDGPAVILPNGDTEYYQHGRRHRIDGPAIDYQEMKIWFKQGKYHREDGPAYIKGNIELWFYDDYSIPESLTKHITHPDSVVDWKDGIITYTDQDGECHRDEDEPSMIFFDETIVYCYHGRWHRHEYGPTLITPNGHYEWFFGGSRHNHNGPSSDNPSGYKQYFVNDEQITEQEYNRLSEYDKMWDD